MTITLQKFEQVLKYTCLKNLSKPNPHEFRVLSLNIRSLKSNFHKLKDEIEQVQKFDAICLSDISLNPEQTTMGNQNIFA